MLTRQLCGGDTCSPEPPIRDFPGVIRLALARAAACDGAGLHQLDTGERALLVRLVRNVSAATPEESVRIANPTLAAGLHVSERTIHRMKAGLEAKGWITRQQVQSRRRGMQISDVRLTQHALETLGLAGAVVPAAPPFFQRPPKVTDALLFPQSVLQRQPCGGLEFFETETTVAPDTGLSRSENPTCCDSTQVATKPHTCLHEHLVPSEPKTMLSIETEPSATDSPVSPALAEITAETEIRATKETCSQPLDGRSGIYEVAMEFPVQQPTVSDASHVLPDDIRSLADEGGVTVAGVRLLMGLATKAGTRLGHVLQVAKDSVLKSRKPFAYMKELLRTGKDWSALALGAQRLEEEQLQVTALVSDLDQLRAAMAEGLYSHAKRKFVWRVEFGAIHQSTVEDAAQGGIGRWLVLHDVSGLATAWREGKIFRVTQAAIEESGEASNRDSRRCTLFSAVVPRVDGRGSLHCALDRVMTAEA